MTGVILAAGKGSRLGNYTAELPKSLLPLNKQGTLLDYNLQMLQKLNIEETLIVTGFGAEKIQQHVAHMKNVRCLLNPFWNYCNVLGSLFIALPYIKGDFLFLHADTLVGINGWQKLLTHAGEIVFPYVSKNCGDEEMKVRIDKQGYLLEVSKTMENDKAQGEFLGIAKFSKSTLPLLYDSSVSLFMRGRVDYYMEAAVQDIIDKQLATVMTFDIGKEIFVEVDFEEDYKHAKEIFSKNNN